MQAYNIFVKRKDTEIKELITAINNNNSKEQIKDNRIRNLELKCRQLQNEAFATERVIHGLREEVKEWQQKLKLEKEERAFFHKNALDTKKKSKLLKVSLQRT